MKFWKTLAVLVLKCNIIFTTSTCTDSRWIAVIGCYTKAAKKRVISRDTKCRPLQCLKMSTWPDAYKRRGILAYKSPGNQRVCRVFIPHTNILFPGSQERENGNNIYFNKFFVSLENIHFINISQQDFQNFTVELSPFHLPQCNSLHVSNKSSLGLTAKKLGIGLQTQIIIFSLFHFWFFCLLFPTILFIFCSESKSCCLRLLYRKHLLESSSWILTLFWNLSEKSCVQH